MFSKTIKNISRISSVRIPKLTYVAVSLVLFNQVQRNPMCFIKSQPTHTNVFPDLIEKTKNSVLVIYSRQTNRPIGFGIVLDTKGHFLIVSDILQDSEQAGHYYVKPFGESDGSTLKFEIVENFPLYKITLCQIKEDQIPTLTPVNFDQQTQIGQQVYGISKDYNDINLFDSTIILENSFTLNGKLLDHGVFSVLSPFLVMNHMIPMLSGSPVFNDHGNLVGIIRRDEILSDKQVAIDTNFLKPFLEQLNSGSTPRPAHLGLSVKTSEQGGAFIIKISSDSPADRAGFKLGEVIKSINGLKMQSSADVLKVVGFNVNKRLEVIVDRDGKQRTVQVTTQ